MKKGNVTDIEEMIADAKAEEEVAREQAKAAADRQFKEDLREQLKENLLETVKNKKASNKVTIDLDEYVMLDNKSKDLDRLLTAIISDLGLNYNRERLRVKDGDNIVDALRVLYPEAYDHLLAIELEQEGE